MRILTDILTTLHFVAMAGLACYGLHRLWMLRHWLLLSRQPKQPLLWLDDENCPVVTVQLPLYNERFVAQRLIEATAQLDWPNDRLQIQVLDDSNDETCGVVDAAVAHWQALGVDIEVLRRDSRQGYKAGALAAATSKARGEFLAVFDADFIPESDFLRRTMANFTQPEIGMVQARWGFLNREQSWLTQLQAILLGPHFGIEHRVRCHQGLFFNFNGTAGVWRRQTIVDGGGWQADTVTEDLDLSYRCQMKGWKFCYVDDVVVPSELPVTLGDFRGQQQRWAKGSMQTARKILPLVLRSRQSRGVKIEAMAHLLANLGWLCAAIASITLYPALLSRSTLHLWQILAIDVPLFLLASLAILSYFFLYAYREIGWKAALWVPVLPLLTLGMAPSLAWAALCGLFQRGGVFNRTAKYGTSNQTPVKRLLPVYSHKSYRVLWVNGALVLYSILPVVLTIQNHNWLALPLVGLFPLGFFLVFVKDFLEIRHNL
ncbi:glycosyltransferase [Desulfuromonas acetoxidans]|uniref:Glycosyl transferase, family 2 n=1 Tax=Desulfuromonas acetoxidans (strain DSM 684 / 11070) TaxID=281689 RepID=Q1JVS9_DESA6|nr:glycosyl transferase, family 2 [Desulfuromonas acetoxidans DSM 684]MBF0644572.1 glycosyltransferase [Desulfuromonas acetoxidans]NVD23901.1 glycosyltransferase [Desulfuromonas acetoxidans]NVE16198.1 glycosyltransferase [Desulfuromonas acetoxidans]